MMFVLPFNASDDKLREAAREWVDLFATGRTDEAAAFLASDPAHAVWSPDRIRTVIARFIPPHSCYGNHSPRITSCGTAKTIQEFDDPELDKPCHLVVHWIPSPKTSGKYPGRIGEVHFELPINGYWSSAVAIFFIKDVGNGLALELHDLLVDDAPD